MAMGLKLVRVAGQSQNSGGIEGNLPIDASYSQALGRGDPLHLNGGNIELAANNAHIHGVFLGCRYEEADGSIKHKAAWDGAAGRSNISAVVQFAEGGTFVIRTDASLGNIDATIVGTRRNMILNAPDMTYGDSRVTLGAASATGPLYVVGLHETPGNTWGNTGIEVVVTVAAPQRTV